MRDDFCFQGILPTIFSVTVFWTVTIASARVPRDFVIRIISVYRRGVVPHPNREACRTLPEGPNQPRSLGVRKGLLAIPPIGDLNWVFGPRLFVHPHLGTVWVCTLIAVFLGPLFIACSSVFPQRFFLRARRVYGPLTRP